MKYIWERERERDLIYKSWNKCIWEKERVCTSIINPLHKANDWEKERERHT